VRVPRSLVALCACGFSVLVAPTVAQSTPTLPPDLVALEQKMAALHFNSEQLTVQVEIASAGGLLGQGTPPLVFLAAGSGVESVAPPEGSFKLELLGQAHEVRDVGGAVYTEEPEVAKTDGGRPWVRSAGKGVTPSLGLGPAGLTGATGGGAEGTFGKLVELVNSATSIEEIGPAVVDDQPVIEFSAPIDLTKVAGWSKLLSSGTSKALGGKVEEPTSELEIFLAANGLPVRLRISVRADGSAETFTTDTLALEVPVTVQAPPARETIGEAQLKTLQRAASKRKAALGARRICRKLSAKQATRCRKVVIVRG
jgi:hypothetical protein